MEHNRKENKKKAWIAVIGAAHGIKGDVWLKIFSAEPQILKTYGILYDEIGRSYEIVTLRVQKKGVIAHFKGVEERNDAEALKGINLYVERDQLPDNLDEDEFYQIDLIGLRVYDDVNQFWGEVSGLFNFGAGDLLEIRLISRKTVLIPFSKAAVTKICMDSGFIVIDPVAAGLSEDKELSKELELKNEDKGITK
ncbi:ribosome maturation factor RimM [Bartonella sp. F02]|uniref:ribosome maturation factor RimM n=1 Tax=Bartonella sp. F02 TaxID=2967262 RepID=UPI0022A9CBD7|nr:ribosome maturation factor RimM [Bartonella sp. F02]MCZ2327852.1 ribosome maturation factor RimM [Bartonella sp. F02]